MILLRVNTVSYNWFPNISMSEFQVYLASELLLLFYNWIYNNIVREIKF